MDAMAPHWTVYIQALATPIVALIAGAVASVIAYRQWQTAKAKVVLDLFEKRLEVYELVSGSIFGVLQHGASNIDQKITGPFSVGMKKSKFLFGAEVYDYLECIWLTLHNLRINSRRQSDEFGTDIEHLFKKEDKLMSDITRFHDNFDNMVAPYMQMSTKNSAPIRILRLPSKFFIGSSSSEKQSHKDASIDK